MSCQILSGVVCCSHDADMIALDSQAVPIESIIQRAGFIDLMGREL